MKVKKNISFWKGHREEVRVLETGIVQINLVRAQLEDSRPKILLKKLEICQTKENLDTIGQIERTFPSRLAGQNRPNARPLTRPDRPKFGVSLVQTNPNMGICQAKRNKMLLWPNRKDG